MYVMIPVRYSSLYVQPRHLLLDARFKFPVFLFDHVNIPFDMSSRLDGHKCMHGDSTLFIVLPAAL